MSVPFQDNAAPYGSSRVTSKAGAVTYVAENIVFNFPTLKVERKDQLGAPNGFALIKGQPTGTCTLQMTTTSTAFPALGDLLETWADLPATGPYNVNPGAWVISDMGVPFEQLGYYKVNVSMMQALFTSS